jgi:hypothetical protein
MAKTIHVGLIVMMANTPVIIATANVIGGKRKDKGEKKRH